MNVKFLLKQWVIFGSLVVSVTVQAQQELENSGLIPVVIAEVSTTQSLEAPDSSPESEAGWVKETVEPQTKKIERFVMPITNWVEEKLHDSSIANPIIKQTNQPRPSSSLLSLREAIDIARKQYPGTVLSADKVNIENQLTFRIKILSDAGVIRVVQVAGEIPKKEGNE